jgi:YidC/Oxa1 family membrane protein insertase
MDRNSTIGLVLIGLIITVFSVMNQPSEAEIKAAQQKEAKAARKKAVKKESAVEPRQATNASTTTKIAAKG